MCTNTLELECAGRDLTTAHIWRIFRIISSGDQSPLLHAASGHVENASTWSQEKHPSRSVGLSRMLRLAVDCSQPQAGRTEPHHRARATHSIGPARDMLVTSDRTQRPSWRDRRDALSALRRHPLSLALVGMRARLRIPKPPASLPRADDGPDALTRNGISRLASPKSAA